MDTNEKFQYQEKKRDAEGVTRPSEKVQFSFDLKSEEKQQLFMRTPRSQAYMDIICSIDLLSSTDEEIIEKLKETVEEDILEEFAQMTPEELLEELRLSFEEEMAQRQIKLQEFNDKLYGVISKCYINGCYVHAIDGHGMILEHYTKNQKLPMALSRAREAYAGCNGKCKCVEAYRWTVRVIAEDGSVEEIHYDEPAEE